MFTVTKTTQGAYTAYVLADTGAGTTATVVPEKGGMVTSFTKNGDEYSWLRIFFPHSAQYISKSESPSSYESSVIDAVSISAS